MGKRRSSAANDLAETRVLGLEAFEKISAIEGIRLSGDMKDDLQALDRRRLTPDERTRFIIGKYGQPSS